MKENPKLIMLCGLPSSGKSTYATKLNIKIENSIILSSDALRKELYGDENNQEHNVELFDTLNKRTVEALNNGITVIYDATNITRKSRAGILSICPKFVVTECHIVWNTIEACIMFDEQRERTVGKDVINRMVKRFQAPYYDEGFSRIEVIFPPTFTDEVSMVYSTRAICDMDIPHDNPHHIHNILKHCSRTAKYLNNYKNNMNNPDLNFAAVVHDVGKPYVKSYLNAKGEQSKYAHYYQHQCVGAWMSYGFKRTNPYVAWLISTHMDIYLNTKYYKNLPEFLKKDLDLLHEADLFAH